MSSVSQGSFLSLSEAFAARRWPSAVDSVAASAVARATGEANFSVTASIGLQPACGLTRRHRPEEHTSELQSLMRIAYAVFCLKKKKVRLNSISAIVQPMHTNA